MAKKTSGLDTRLIGQALAGPRPLGTDEILGDAFKRGEIAINKMQAKRDAEEKEKKAELERFDRAQARLLRSMPKLNKEKLVKGYKPVATKILSAARQEYISLISDPDKSEVEKEMARQKLQDVLNEVDAKNSEFKDKIEFFATINNDDLSKANTAFILKRHRDIAEGNWTYDDATDSLKFDDDSEPIPWSEAMKQGVINKRDDTYKNMLIKVKNTALKSGAKGDPEAIFNQNIDNVIDGMEFTDADRLSIAADFLGYDAVPNGAAIKADIEADGDLDDPKLRKQLDDFIKQNVKTAAKQNFYVGKNTYDDKIAIKNSKAPEPLPEANKIVGKLFGKTKDGNIVLNDPVGLMKEITDSPSEYKGTFNPQTGEYKDVYKDKDGNAKTSSYNLYKESDLINFLDVYVNGRRFKDSGQIKIDINNLIKSPQVRDLLQNLETQMYKPTFGVTKPKGVTLGSGSLKNTGDASTNIDDLFK